MKSRHRESFIQVGRAGGTKQYAHLTRKEYQEYKVYLALDHLTSQQLITQKIREYMEECREHYADIALRFREPGDLEEEKT